MNGMSVPASADPLAELRGLHLPEAVGLWPPAPGWWLAALLAAAVVAAAVFAWHRRRQSLAAHALRELDRIGGRRDADLGTVATALAELIRRVALERFGPTRVASLSGERWRSFLRETWPRTRRGTSFDETASELLSLAPYAPPARLREDADATRERLLASARIWIRGNA